MARISTQYVMLICHRRDTPPRPVFFERQLRLRLFFFFFLVVSCFSSVDYVSTHAPLRHYCQQNSTLAETQPFLHYALFSFDAPALNKTFSQRVAIIAEGFSPLILHMLKEYYIVNTE
jgi:hypothetical protein